MINEGAPKDSPVLNIESISAAQDVKKRTLKKLDKTLRNRGGSRARTIEVLPTEAPIESLLNSKEARYNAIETLFACLKAVRTYYDVFSKQMVVEPDYATRCAASKLLLAYDVGEPVKRQQIIVTNVESMEELQAKLQSSPALRQEMRAMLEEADKKQETA